MIDLKRYYGNNVNHLEEHPGTLKRYNHVLSYLSGEDFDSVLDVGCCSGGFLSQLDDRARFCAGLDISSIVYDSKERELDSSFIRGDVMMLPFNDNSFDTVFCMEVLEHMPKWRDAFDELDRVANSRIIITVPYKEEPLYICCENCGEDTPIYGHINSFSENDFRNFGRDASFNYIESNMPISFYFRKFLNLLRRKMFDGKEVDRDSYVECGGFNRCVYCYTDFEASSIFKRANRKLEMILAKKPGIMLVDIVK